MSEAADGHGASVPLIAGAPFRERQGRRLHGALARRVAVAILRGEIPEGHLFPGEIEYSDQLGISRSALREAFRILAAKGLVESRPKAGTRVAPRHRWSLLDPDLLAWQFESEPAPKFLRDLFELRMLVEPSAAELAAQRRTEEQVREMDEALRAMADNGLATEAGRAADQRFHAILLEATGNDAIMALSSSIMAAIAWTTIFKQRRGGLPRDPMPDHRALHDAVAAGDSAGARQAMEELVRLARADTELALRGQ